MPPHTHHPETNLPIELPHGQGHGHDEGPGHGQKDFHGHGYGEDMNQEPQRNEDGNKEESVDGKSKDKQFMADFMRDVVGLTTGENEGGGKTTGAPFKWPTITDHISLADEAKNHQKHKKPTGMVEHLNNNQEHLNNEQEHLNNDQTSEIEEHKNKNQHVAKIGDTWHYTGDVYHDIDHNLALLKCLGQESTNEEATRQTSHQPKEDDKASNTVADTSQTHADYAFVPVVTTEGPHMAGNKNENGETSYKSEPDAIEENHAHNQGASGDPTEHHGHEQYQEEKVHKGQDDWKAREEATYQGEHQDGGGSQGGRHMWTKREEQGDGHHQVHEDHQDQEGLETTRRVEEDHHENTHNTHRQHSQSTGWSSREEGVHDKKDHHDGWTGHENHHPNHQENHQDSHQNKHHESHQESHHESHTENHHENGHANIQVGHDYNFVPSVDHLKPRSDWRKR